MKAIAPDKWENSPLTGRAEWLVGGALLIISALIRVVFLTANDIALDEPFTLFQASKPLSELGSFFLTENNPPLHFLIAWGSIKLFGLSPFAVRFPFMLFSVLTAWVVFRTGNRHFSGYAGIFAGLLFTLSTQQIFFSHEARTYSLMILFAALSFFSFLNFWRDEQRPGIWISLAIWNALLIYTHYLGILLIAGEIAIGFLFFLRKKSRLIAVLKSGMLTALLYLPGFYLMLVRVNEISEMGTWVDRPGFSSLYGSLAHIMNGGWPLLLTGGVLLIGIIFRWQVLVGFLRSRVGSKWMAGLLLFAGIYLGMFLLSFVFTPVFIPRYTAFLAPLLFLVLAGLVRGIFPGAIRIVGVVLLGFFLLGFNPNPPNHREVKKAVEFCESLNGPDCAVVICPNNFDKAYMYHLDRKLFSMGEEGFRKFYEMNYFSVSGPEGIPPLENFSRIIYLDAGSELMYPGNGVKQALEKEFLLEDSRHFPEVFNVFLFRKP